MALKGYNLVNVGYVERYEIWLIVRVSGKV